MERTRLRAILPLLLLAMVLPSLSNAQQSESGYWTYTVGTPVIDTLSVDKGGGFGIIGGQYVQDEGYYGYAGAGLWVRMTATSSMLFPVTVSQNDGATRQYISFGPTWVFRKGRLLITLGDDVVYYRDDGGADDTETRVAAGLTFVFLNYNVQNEIKVGITVHGQYILGKSQGGIVFGISTYL